MIKTILSLFSPTAAENFEDIENSGKTLKTVLTFLVVGVASCIVLGIVNLITLAKK